MPDPDSAPATLQPGRDQIIGEEVLFVGTGIMGSPMALNLHRRGIKVLACNRSSEKLEPLRRAGVAVTNQLTDTHAARRVAIIMVSTGSVVDELLFGAALGTPLVDRLLADSIVVVMSSIPVETAVSQCARLRARGIRYLDAPVSGGQVAAQNATLTIMAGGDSAVLESVRGILSQLGKVTHVGPTGSGCLAKLANQLIVGVTIGAVAEALTLVELGGGDARAVREALLGGFADSTILTQHGERMLDRHFAPGAHATTQLKDLETALSFAIARKADLPLLTLCAGLYRDLCASERRALDHSALYLAARERARLPPV